MIHCTTTSRPIPAIRQTATEPRAASGWPADTLFDLLQFEPQCVPVQRSPRAQLNSPAFADMLVMEPTPRDHAAMQRFRAKAGSPPVYFEFIQLIS